MPNRFVVFKLYGKWFAVFVESTGRTDGGYVQDTWSDAMDRGWAWLKEKEEAS